MVESVDLTTTNVLLTVIALAVVLQAVAAAVVLVALGRAQRRLTARIDAVEHELKPLAARAAVVLDRLERISVRVDEGTAKLDTALSVTARGAEIALAIVNGRVKRTAAVVAGVARGLKAARDRWREGAPRPPLRMVELPAPIPMHPNTNRMEDDHVSIRR